MESQAIMHLNNVMPTSIYYISTQDRNIILLLKPALPTPPPVRSPEVQEPARSIIRGNLDYHLEQSLSPQLHSGMGELWRHPLNRSYHEEDDSAVGLGISFDNSEINPTYTCDYPLFFSLKSPLWPHSAS